MPTVVGIAGSLREKSYNRALLRAAAELAPPDLQIRIESIAEVPLYDGDVEEAGLPTAVTRLKDALADADGLLLVTPEYNHSIPGVLKNAIDWMSRPNRDTGRVFGDKPVGLMGATPGGVGTRYSQAAWLPVFHALGTRPWFGKSLYVPRASTLFDEIEGRVRLNDDDMRARVSDYLEGFAAFVEQTRVALS